MTRVSTPREDEPIRLIDTAKGHRYRVVLDVAQHHERRRQLTRTFDTLRQARGFVTATRASLSARLSRLRRGRRWLNFATGGSRLGAIFVR